MLISNYNVGSVPYLKKSFTLLFFLTISYMAINSDISQHLPATVGKITRKTILEKTRKW